MSESYIDALLGGLSSIDEFRDYVARWHATDFGATVPEVYEYLGLTWEEYALVVLDESRLRFVAAARRHGKPLDEFKQSKDQLALAARAGDSRELSDLVTYLMDEGVLT